MFEENQQEIIKALLSLILCFIFASIGADISTRIMHEYNYEGVKTCIPGLISGITLAVFTVNFLINRIKITS